MAVKRKLEESTDDVSADVSVKKSKNTEAQPTAPKPKDDLSTKFRTGLFNEFEQNRTLYAASEPYKHGVISALIDDELLRRVRKEIIEQIHFTEKETDIYKIHQSGDLANLDGLDDESLKQLPSLLELRNAMYSGPFRRYISDIANAGPLSGKKTDMAINIYTPGSHLLCHDDVIGSRRVSYILYLTDPDNPWQGDWGGALRLYPTRHMKQAKGPKLRSPDPDFSVSITPAWNQMSFFAVQPGESFHDVEEVYHSGDAETDKGRVRMAISGWFHIPQQGEDGYVEGAEEEAAKSSSLTQLQTKDAFDVPRTEPVVYPDYATTQSKKASGKVAVRELDSLTASDIDYLLQFMAPNFLIEDTVSAMRAAFQSASCICVNEILSEKFAEALREEIKNEPSTYDGPSTDIESSSSWTVARPPHKHRYLFMLPNSPTQDKPDLLSKEPPELSPLKKLLSIHMTSSEFRKWLQLASGLVLRSHDLKARRFRRGADYQLATSYEEDSARLELTLGITPEGKWEAEEPEGETEVEAKEDAQPEEVNNGGYEVWMAPDEDEDDKKDHENEVTNVAPDSTTSGTGTESHGASKPKNTSDPAIYKSSTATEDDGILFSMAAGWNRLSLTLRDHGTHRFVKYVSRNAGADRWDVTGDFEVDWDATPDFDDEEEDQGEEEEEKNKGDDKAQDSENEVFLRQDSSDEDETEDEGSETDDKIRTSFHSSGSTAVVSENM